MGRATPRRGGTRAAAWIAGASFALATAAAAHAEPEPDLAPLVEAHAALDASDYAAASTALARAQASGSATAAQLADIYKQSGIAFAALGKSREAADAFARWLALVPDASLPAGTSPKIVRPFAQAQTAAHAAGALVVHAETSPGTAATPPSVTIVVTHDPLNMVAAAFVAIRVDGHDAQPLTMPGHDRIAIDLPRGAHLELHAAALDERGNHVVDLSPLVIDAPVLAPVAQPAAPRASEDHARPVYRAWWAYGGVAVALAGVGTGFGFAARSATTELDGIERASARYTSADADRVESRARRDVDVANVGFVAAGVFAAASGVLWATRPHAREHAQLAPTLAPGTAGVALEMPW